MCGSQCGTISATQPHILICTLEAKNPDEPAQRGLRYQSMVNGRQENIFPSQGVFSQPMYLFL